MRVVVVVMVVVVVVGAPLLALGAADEAPAAAASGPLLLLVIVMLLGAASAVPMGAALVLDTAEGSAGAVAAPSGLGTGAVLDAAAARGPTNAAHPTDSKSAGGLRGAVNICVTT